MSHSASVRSLQYFTMFAKQFWAAQMQITEYRRKVQNIFKPQRKNTLSLISIFKLHTYSIPHIFQWVKQRIYFMSHSVSITWTDSSTTSSGNGVTVFVSTAVVPGLYLYVPPLVHWKKERIFSWVLRYFLKTYI